MPRKTRRTIAEAELRQFYFDEQLTIERVAAHYRVSATTIARRFRDLGLRPRRRGPVPGHVLLRLSPRRPIEWTADCAYVVGLIATDGNLSKKPWRITITSNDVPLLEAVNARLGLRGLIRPQTPGYGSRCHYLAWSDRHFYGWLTDIGLMPAKSLRLGSLTVPDARFADFLRGCIDGDGSITTYVDRYNTFKSPRYVYTRLFVSVVSASRPFIDWLRQTINRLYGLSGFVTVKTSPIHHDVWCLKYAKRESLALLRVMYYAPDVLCLCRKQAIALRFLTAPHVPPRGGPGRPMVV